MVGVLPKHDDGLWALFGGKRRNGSLFIERLQVEQKVMQLKPHFGKKSKMGTPSVFHSSDLRERVQEQLVWGQGLELMFLPVKNRGSTIIWRQPGRDRKKKRRKNANCRFNGQFIALCSE